MIYRTAHRATYRNLNNNLGTLSYRIAQLTNQIASERRINTPSDDPSGAAKVLGTRSTLSNIAQYTTNIAVSDLWLTNSGSAIQSIKETLDSVYSDLEQGATDTNAAQRGILAASVTEAFQSLLQFANQGKIGDSYIFGGQKVTTQPFSMQVEAQKVVAGCQNSAKWNGKVVNYGDATFNSRPDLPVHSQDFLVEVVQAGGVDSKYYSSTSTLSTGILNGAGYSLRFNALDAKYNNLKLNFQVGKREDAPETGSIASNNGITFSGAQSPVTVKYVAGPADSSVTSAATARWDAAGNTMIVTLNRTDSGSARATADDVIAAVNAEALAVPVNLTAANSTDGLNTSDGTGLVSSTGSVSFNNPIEVKVDGDTVNVYLPQLAGGSAMTVAADAVAAFLNSNPPTSTMFSTTVVTGGANAVNATDAPVEFKAGVPYTLAHVGMNPKGTQNDLVWSVKNGTAYIGTAGNNLSVEYKVVYPFTTDPNPPISFNSSGEITVNVAVSAAMYNKAFVQVYNDPSSGAYKDADKANEIALNASILTTANDVRQMVAEHPQLSRIVEVELADGSSGEGNINNLSRKQFAEGYDQPAMFRVSQDGGKTWGPPMSFSASEYETGGMFYNAYLGHASMTTSLPGKGNDLVFTAKHMGTWGNDLRVEYKLPQTRPSAASLTVGPESWNICVNLATDAQGNVLTTANEIKDMINSHPVASQWVTADLANYHEGGNGVVRAMKCTSLTVAEPYQSDGRNVITPLGYATADIGFNYSAPAQKCPNIIFQALEHGEGGNDIGIRYTTSADPTYFSSASAASGSYQDHTSVRYETVNGQTVMVVHLATVTLPECPDPDDLEATAKWKESWPAYSCTETRAVTTTAGDVIQAVIDQNTKDPANAVVWPSMEKWPQGWDSTAKVGPTDGTVWLTGGDNAKDASNHGINLRFIPDGTSLQVGDVFEVPVGWYRGDDKLMEINASSSVRNTINVPGSTLFGGNGKDGNILDTMQRIIWALDNNDSELIGKELPKIRAAIEQVTTLETQLGSKQIRNQYIARNLEQAKYGAETFLSQTEDADFAQLITDLKNAQTVYEACLGATGLTHKVSLLNYI